MWDHCEESVPMSTYSVAFVVSDFVSLKSGSWRRSYNGRSFRVWSRDNVLTKTKFASDIGQKIMDYFEKFLESNYPLPKQDIVILPHLVESLSENWGLAMYR